jgi:hypothetical protein
MTSYFSNIRPVAEGMYPIVIIDRAQNENDTVKQGANYFLAMKPQIVLIGSIFTNLQSLKPLWTNYTGLVNITLTIAVITATITTISSVADYYLGKYISPYIERAIGADANSFLKRSVYPILLDHSGNLAHVVAAGVAVAKYAFGNQAEAITSFVFLGIGYFDRKGYLTFRVSAFYNKQLALVSSVAGFILGTPLTKLICAFDIFFTVIPVVLDRLKLIVDAYVCNRMGKAGIHYPSLYSLGNSANSTRNRPVLTKEEFLNLVKEGFTDFKGNKTPLYINPSHVADSPKIDGNTDGVEYGSLLTLFDTIDWKNEESFNALLANVKNDERFLDTMKKGKTKGIEDIFEIIDTLDAIKLCENTIRKFNNLDIFSDQDAAVMDILMSNKFLIAIALKKVGSNPINFLSEEINNLKKKLIDNPRFKEGSKGIDMMTEEEKNFLIQWTRDQLACFVDNLSGKKRPQGSVDAYHETQKTGLLCIKHLQNLSEQVKSNPEEKMLSIEFQSNILKMSVEGGDYCVVAITRVVKEMFTTFVSTTDSEGVALKGRISFSLSKKRQEIGQELTRQLLATRSGMQEMANGDVHYINTIIVSLFQGLGIDMSDMNRDLAVDKSPITEAIVTTLFPFARTGFWHNAYPASESFAITKEDFMCEVNRKINDRPADTWSEKLKKYWEIAKETYVDAFRLAHSHLKNTYTTDVLVDAFDSMIQLKAISNEEVTNWWENYVKEHGGDDDDATMMQHIYGSDAFGDSDVLVIPGMITTDKKGETIYSRKCLEIMLLEMGFLQRGPLVEPKKPEIKDKEHVVEVKA